jgi:hypothetical protein
MKGTKEKNRKTVKKADDAILPIGRLLARVFLVIAILFGGAMATLYFLKYLHDRDQALTRKCGGCIEANANNMAAAISDYYAVPENFDFPTLETLKEEYYFTSDCGPYQHTYTVEEISSPDGGTLAKITGIPHEECKYLRGKKYVIYAGTSIVNDREEGWQ